MSASRGKWGPRRVNGQPAMWHFEDTKAHVKSHGGFAGCGVKDVAVTNRAIDPASGSKGRVAADRYGADVLAHDPRAGRAATQTIVAEPDLVVECASSGWCGAVVGWDRGVSGWAVILEDRHGRRRPFDLTPAGFMLDGAIVTLVRPVTPPALPGRSRTASGSVAVSPHRARVARGSRIWVEGKQDAELVEKVWGDDLRVEGVVVEHLGGIDDLLDKLAVFKPDHERRVGVLVDHLVNGSKESRIAAAALAQYPQTVLVVGHPYVDVWQAVRPSSLGISAWPEVPRSIPWKQGVCAGLGWPDDPAKAWQRILRSVSTYADLEPALLGRVEELIDFVTAQP